MLAGIERAEGPVTLAELSAATGLHPNTLRDHLEALEHLGLVLRRRSAPAGPGRPASSFEAAPDRQAGQTEYAGLATALAATIHRTSRDPGRDATAAGQEWGRELATGRGRSGPVDEAEARHEVVALFADVGFAPEADEHAKEVRLTQCPLLDAALRYPDVVCAVHLGIAQGVLLEHGADPERAELFPFSEPGACRLHLDAPGPGGRR